MMKTFADPEKFYTLSFGDKMAGSAVTLLLGMGITFIILFLLWGCVGVMGTILKSQDKKAAAKAAAAAMVTEGAAVGIPDATPVAAAPVAAPAAAGNNDLTPVIAAAILAYDEDGVQTNLVVKKIKRVSGPTTSWENAGHRDCTDSRRM